MPPKKKIVAQEAPEPAGVGTAAAEAGEKIPKRRGRPPRKVADNSAPEPAEAKVSKPRGRPPKPKVVVSDVEDEETGAPSPKYLPPKPRGRPPKPKVIPEDEETGDSASPEQTPPKRRPRSRPVKKVVPQLSDGDESPEQPAPKRKGRPPKKAAAAEADVGHVAEAEPLRVSPPKQAGRQPRKPAAVGHADEGSGASESPEQLKPRGRQPKKAAAAGHADEGSGASESPEQPAPKQRGRPPKEVVPAEKDDGQHLHDLAAVPEAVYYGTADHNVAAAEGFEADLPANEGRVLDRTYYVRENFSPRHSLENTINSLDPADEELPQNGGDLGAVGPGKDNKERLWCVECSWEAFPGCLELHHEYGPPDAILGSFHRLASVVGRMAKFLQVLPPDALRLRLSVETDDGSVSGDIECTLTVSELSSGNRQTLCTSLFAGKELMPERTHLALPLDNFKRAKVAGLQLQLPERLPWTNLKAGAILLCGEHDYKRQGDGDADRDEDDATDYSSDRDPPGVRLYYGAALPHQGVGASVLGYVTGSLKLLTKSRQKALVVREVKLL